MKSMYSRQADHHKIIDAMRQCFANYPEVREEIYPTGIRRYFPNGQWCDLFFYKKSVNILRFSRGAWMIRQEPILGLAFDEVHKVIAKIKLHSVDTIRERAIPAIIAKMAQAPDGVRYDA